MKQQRFHIGQEVVCTNRNGWVAIEDVTDRTGPEFNQVCRVTGYEEPLNGENFIFLSGFHPEDSFLEGFFEPIVSDSVLESELSSIEQFEYNYNEQL